MQKGDLVTIDFWAFGVTSQEEHPIFLVEPNHITIDHSQNEENGRLRFSRRTGICLNEDEETKKMFRSNRTLNVKHRFPPKSKK